MENKNAWPFVKVYVFIFPFFNRQGFDVFARQGQIGGHAQIG
jgi:hypothetical protein